MVDLNDPAHPAHSNHVISTKGRMARRVWHHESPLFESTKQNLLLDWNREIVEQCGFIDSEQDIWYVKNMHEKPRTNFLMDDIQTANILDEIYTNLKRNVLGIFHTHPNGVPWPSPRDIVGWPNPKLGWRYFIVNGEDVLEWELVDG